MVNCEGSSSIVNSSISGLLTPWCYGNKKGRAWAEDVGPWRYALEDYAWPPSLPSLPSLVVRG